jgi:HAAS domain-containing protein
VSDDPRARFVSALRRGLRCGPLKRRRVVREIAAHLDDMVAELEARGMAEPAAVQEALRRLGDVGTITSAFGEVRPERGRWSGVRWLRSPAWVAVGAMSLVTAWAAELPQASGAKPTSPALPAIHSRQLARPSDREHRRGDDRRLFVRARHPRRP